MARRSLSLALCLLLLWSCSEPAPLSAPPRVDDAALVISDGAHGGGNAGFFFLPPLVRRSGPYTGLFDASASPVVRICAWSGAACVGADVAVFTRTSDPGITLHGQSFRVDWETRDLDLEAGEVYRIRAYVGAALLGFADVKVIGSGGHNKRVEAGYIPLIAGHHLPISFRIEAGAAGRQIAFTSARDGDAEIWVADADGSNPTQLTHDAAVDMEPTWSPDGSKLAFTSLRSGVHDVWVMNADGSGATNLTATTGGGAAPAWSPDGTKIAYVKDYDIYVMDADGTDPVNVSNDPPNVGYEDSDPSWSPDGTKLAFTSLRGDDFEIWVMDADGSDETQLTDGSSDGDPTWSPDGSRIAFVRTPNGVHLLYIMDADGTNEAPVMPAGGHVSSPAWFPGDLIAFTSTSDGDYEILVIAPDGTGLAQLTFNEVYDDHAAWMP
ncbi:MAG TPA: DPP IV N-terminal domain-containing protein [Gemmatimonadaceae bacterium]|nr:DPP IV N-terminal domain-containing protein [Gemmatimonadaceae bacterium]